MWTDRSCLAFACFSPDWQEVHCATCLLCLPRSRSEILVEGLLLSGAGDWTMSKPASSRLVVMTEDTSLES